MRLILALAALAAFTSRASAQVTINWSSVGNPGNAADTTLMSDGTSGYGSVSYVYNIGTYDVTVTQYVVFLNAKDPTGADPLGLYNSGMSDPTYGGITYTAAAANGSKYSVISGDSNHPVNYVSFYDTLRFANWLDNGQGNGDTETGAYTLMGGTPTPSNGDSITRNAGATIFLPSENEWYKAAFYNPATTSYFRYPTSSNTAPTASVPTSAANSANYNNAVGNVTSVGAYGGTTSPYHAFDMGGNVYQWNEAIITNVDGTFRGLRGGSFAGDSSSMLSAFRNYDDPSGDLNRGIGFRVASIPGSPLFADVNHDHVVNGLDISLIASHWLASGIGIPGDGNGDGVVNGLDIALVASFWLQTDGGAATSPAAVPEPSTIVLAALGVLACFMARRAYPRPCSA
jgi:formylglycine-generating enzyme required for sulfatase activity